MTPEQQAAYIVAQAAVLSARVAENDYRKARGETIAHAQDAFDALIDESAVHHNAVISFFQG